MPFSRPNVSDLVSRIAADIAARLPGSQPLLRGAYTAVLARVVAGAVHGLYGYLDYIARQIHPDTAEQAELERHAARRGMARKAAAAASGTVTFSGSDGNSVPIGTLLQRADGAEYVTAAEGTITNGSATTTVTASTPGIDGNAEAALVLTLVNPLSGIEPQAAVDGDGLTGGTDAETDSALRQRIYLHDSQPVMGGTAHDYVNWALQVAGVTRAWCFPQQRGDGSVDVTFVVDDDPDGPIPSASQVETVLTHLYPLRPVTADLLVYAPAPVAIDLTIALTPQTAAVQAAVAAELGDLLRREAQPEDGSGSGTILISHLREAISLASGETDHVLTAPAADVTFNAGEIATLGVITWA